MNQEAHRQEFDHLIKTATTYLQMSCNILPVLPQQLGHKFDHTIKGSKAILVSSFGKIWYLLSHRCCVPRFSLKAFLVLKMKLLKCFYHIWVWQQFFSMVQNRLKKTVNIASTEGHTWNLVKIGQAVSEKMFKDFTILYMYRALGKGQITRGRGHDAYSDGLERHGMMTSLQKPSRHVTC